MYVFFLLYNRFKHIGSNVYRIWGLVYSKVKEQIMSIIYTKTYFSH